MVSLDIYGFSISWYLTVDMAIIFGVGNFTDADSLGILGKYDFI